MALDEYDKLHKWNDVYRSFKRFAHCDDGAIAEGYSDRIVQLLAKDWEHFPGLNQLTASNHAFKAFVLRHIDATTDPEDLRKAQKNAQELCPVGAEALCKVIANATARALEGK